MEAFLVILGAIALIPAMFALALLVAMWRAWWLHPLWALVIVPLGVPQIGYWHFLGLGMFAHAWLSWKTAEQSTGDATKKEASDIAATVIVMFVWPVITYYLVRWYLS